MYTGLASKMMFFAETIRGNTVHVRGQWKSKNSCSWAGMSYSAVAPRRHGGGLSYANVCTRGWPQRWCFSPVCVEVEQMLWLKHSKAWWLVWPQFLSLKELSWYRQVFASNFFFMDRISSLRNCASSKETCSCPFVWYFHTLYWDDITIIWDEKIVYFFNQEKKMR